MQYHWFSFFLAIFRPSLPPFLSPSLHHSVPPPLQSRIPPAHPILNNRRAFSVAEESFGISPLLRPEEMETPDKITLLTYLSLFHEFFSDTEPAGLAPPTGGSDKAAPSQKATPTKRKLVHPNILRIYTL